MKKRLAAVIQACQIIVFAITVYINRKLRYSRWLKVRHSLSLALISNMTRACSEG